MVPATGEVNNSSIGQKSGDDAIKRRLDDRAASDDLVAFEAPVAVDGPDMTIDLTGVPDALDGPLNRPLPNPLAPGADLYLRQRFT